MNLPSNPQKRLAIKKIFQYSSSILFAKILFAKISFLSLPKCSSSAPEPQKLDPPFICISPCYALTTTNTNITSDPKTPTTTLVFSGLNSEPLFSGYNVRYGKKDDIIKDHSNKTKNLVLHSSSSNSKNSLDTRKIGQKGPFPSFRTSQTLSSTNFVLLTINNTQPGYSIYISAYNLSDNIESTLSNPLLLQ